MYVTLDRLVRKGYLESSLAGGGEQRAGRRRRYFRATADGKEALRISYDALVSLWSGLESAVEEG